MKALVSICCLLTGSFAFNADRHLTAKRGSLHSFHRQGGAEVKKSPRTMVHIHPALPPDIIDIGVSVDTFAPQPFWLLMIAAPRWEITQRLIGPITPILLLSLVHFLVVLLAAAAPGGLEPILIFADVFDPTKNQLDGMVKLFEFRDFVAEEWPHVLIWDLFAGRCIWLDALTRGVPRSLLAPSLLLTNFIGPPGLLLYTVLCLIAGQGFPTLGLEGIDSLTEGEKNSR